MTNEPTPYTPIVTPPTARPGVVSQTTAIEQSRAVAQVQAAVLIAKQAPRSEDVAVEQMRQTTRQMALAERAFFRFPRGGKNVTGPSIHLARELARCWGNIDYGLQELHRDDVKGESEMQAYAWDLQTNARTSTTFISPHRRDKKDVTGGEALTEIRDVYENNANVGARRLREMIFNLLPVWFREEAIKNLNATLRDGGGVPLPQRIANALKAFEPMGVTKAKLETKVGRPTSEWNEHDVAQLIVVFQSIDRGESSVVDEFPAERVTDEELDVTPRRRKTTRKPTAPTEVGDTEQMVPPLSENAVAALDAAFAAEGWADNDVAGKLAWLSSQTGTTVGAINELTAEQAEQAINALTGGTQQ